MPSSADIAFGHFDDELHYAYIAQVMTDIGGVWFRFRMIAAQLTSPSCPDSKGKLLLDQQIGGWEIEWRNDLLFAVQNRLPVVDESRIVTECGREFGVEHLVLPLSEDGEKVDRLFGSMSFSDPPSSVGGDAAGMDWAAIKSVELEKRLFITALRRVDHC